MLVNMNEIHYDLYNICSSVLKAIYLHAKMHSRFKLNSVEQRVLKWFIRNKSKSLKEKKTWSLRKTNNGVSNTW